MNVFRISILSVLLILSFRNESRSEENTPIKIGLLIQDNKSIAAKQAVEMAVNSVNSKGGFKGRIFQLVVLSMEGPWGTGSTKAVDLIFKEKVFGIIGSHDGRNSHLVEQVCTKAHIPFLSTWSADPTLSQAFIPWFFNVVPNDNQQASVLINEIYKKRKLKKVAVISDRSYDSSQALRFFLKKVKEESFIDPILFTAEDSGKNLSSLPDQINIKHIQGIILLTQPVITANIIQIIKEDKIKQPVFGSLLSQINKSDIDNLQIYPVSAFLEQNEKRKAFMKEFVKTYAKEAGEDAAYAFDAADLMISAIKNAGADPEKVRDELSKIQWEGVTGVIRFDERGNRRISSNPQSQQ